MLSVYTEQNHADYHYWGELHHLGESGGTSVVPKAKSTVTQCTSPLLQSCHNQGSAEGKY